MIRFTTLLFSSILVAIYLLAFLDNAKADKFLSDGRLLAVAIDASTIKVFDTNTLRATSTITGVQSSDFAATTGSDLGLIAARRLSPGPDAIGIFDASTRRIVGNIDIATNFSTFSFQFIDGTTTIVGTGSYNKYYDPRYFLSVGPSYSNISLEGAPAGQDYISYSVDKNRYFTIPDHKNDVDLVHLGNVVYPGVSFWYGRCIIRPVRHPTLRVYAACGRAYDRIYGFEYKRDRFLARSMFRSMAASWTSFFPMMEAASS